jgi:hypothetical protein
MPASNYTYTDIINKKTKTPIKKCPSPPQHITDHRLDKLVERISKRE